MANPAKQPNKPIDNDPGSKILEPSVQILLTQATYEYIVAKYLTQKERDAWEQKFAGQSDSSKLVAEFIDEIETKSDKSLKDLMQPLQSQITQDVTNVMTETMIEALPAKQ